MPVFSVIVPVYNVEEYLNQCVDSVLKQSFTDFELLLIDDGSPDNAGKICDMYNQKDTRVKVVHKENGGLSSARNYGLRIAKGDYIIFLDSDDYWDNPDALNLIQRQIETTQADVVLLQHRKLDMHSGMIVGEPEKIDVQHLTALPYDEQMKYCVAKQLYDTCAWNKAFRKRLTEETDLFFTEGIISEDLDWAARLSLAAKKLAIVEVPVHIYRKGRSGSITTSLKMKNLIDTKGSIERCLAYIEDLNLSESFTEAYLSYVAYRYAIWMAESAVVTDQSKTELIKEMKAHRWLLRYALNPKVVLVSKLTKLLGYRLSSKILGLYLMRK